MGSSVPEGLVTSVLVIKPKVRPQREGSLLSAGVEPQFGITRLRNESRADPVLSLSDFLAFNDGYFGAGFFSLTFFKRDPHRGHFSVLAYWMSPQEGH
jgi:hypothetical protein